MAKKTYRRSERTGKIVKSGKNVMVIGLGEIGKPLFEIIKEKYYAIGVDIEPLTFNDNVSILHICYPYQIEDFVATSVDYIDKYNPDLVIVNSTVVPGTTRAIYEKIDRPIVYSPVRGKHIEMGKDLLHYTKYIAGIDDETTRLAVEHFESIDMKTRVFSSPECLELAKLLSTTYFGLLIAWAQEVERLGRQFDVDYNELMSFIKEIDYFPPVIFSPGYIGGHCIVPNIDLLEKIVESDFLDAILKSNEIKAKELIENGKSLDERLIPKKIR